MAPSEGEVFVVVITPNVCHSGVLGVEGGTRDETKVSSPFTKSTGRAHVLLGHRLQTSCFLESQPPSITAAASRGVVTRGQRSAPSPTQMLIRQQEGWARAEQMDTSVRFVFRVPRSGVTVR